MVLKHLLLVMCRGVVLVDSSHAFDYVAGAGVLHWQRSVNYIVNSMSNRFSMSRVSSSFTSSISVLLRMLLHVTPLIMLHRT